MNARGPRRLLARMRVAGLLLLVTSIAACTVPKDAPEQRTQARDDLNRLWSLIFTRSVPIGGLTRGVEYSYNGYAFKSLQEINQYNIQSSRRIPDTQQTIQLRETPLESPYWWQAQSAEGANELLQAVREWRDSTRADAWSNLSFESVLEKALLQRDLFQMYALLVLAGQKTEDAGMRELALQVERDIAEALRCTLLDEREYSQLLAALPREPPPGFVTSTPASLQHNYLPRRALTDEAGWMEMPGGGPPFRHFKDYGGRSFVRVFMRAPQRSVQDMDALWRELFLTYGEQLHTGSVVETPPAGMETMLVRSFGVLLADGSYRDSRWPEEIIIRIFKRPRPQVDLASSDFRGMLFYQYKLSRDLRRRVPDTLSLRRVRDDDLQFFGFFGDTPDPYNAYSNGLTTMRSNCITCHSELFYGLNTVFSFERHPHRAVPIDAAGNHMLRVRSAGVYELLTEEFARLQQLLREPSHVKGVQTCKRSSIDYFVRQ